MKKKRIAIIHDSLNMGGTEKALIYMLDHFDYEQYDVTLWLLDSNGALQNEINKHVHLAYYSNMPVKAGTLAKHYFHEKSYCKGLKSLISKVSSRINLNHFYKNMVYDIKSLPYVDSSVYDAVIVYQGLYINLLATAIYRFRALKRITWIHMKFRHSEEEQKLFGRLYQKMDHIFCVSKDIQKHYLDFYGKYNKQTSVLYNILNEADILSKAAESCDLQDNTPFLLTVGRISPEKGQILIPQITEKLLLDGYIFRWIVIGNGSQYKELEAEILKRKLNNTVLLTGSLNNPYPYYRKCLIYVQPSYSEGYCTSTCEAKIFNKPIVATDVSGMREQITDGITGLIAEVNADSIYEKIKELLDRPGLMADFSENIRKESKNTEDDYYSRLYSILNIM